MAVEGPAVPESDASEVVSPKVPAGGVGAVALPLVVAALAQVLNIEVESGALEVFILAVSAAVGSVLAAYKKLDPRRV